MTSLRRWEASWKDDRARYLSATAFPLRLRVVIPAERDLFGPFFLCDDYLFAVDWQGHPMGFEAQLRSARVSSGRIEMRTEGLERRGGGVNAEDDKGYTLRHTSGSSV